MTSTCNLDETPYRVTSSKGFDDTANTGFKESYMQFHLLLKESSLNQAIRSFDEGNTDEKRTRMGKPSRTDHHSKKV